MKGKKKNLAGIPFIMDDLEATHACVLICFSYVLLFATLWTVPHQAPLLGILQARILEWVAMPSSRGYSHPKDRTSVCLLQRWVLYHSLCHLGGNPTDHITEFLWKNLVRKHPYTHT